MSSKKAASIADLEKEHNTLQMEVRNRRDQVQALQLELTGLLAAQRGRAKERAPLQTALETAQRSEQEAQEALSRHIGKVTEEQFSEKLYTASQIKEQARLALATFDSQRSDSEHIAERRADLQKAEEERKQLEDRAGGLAQELDRAVQQERRAALTRLYSTYADLYDILEKDGAALARMRNYDPAWLHQAMQDLTLSEEDLWSCVAPMYSASGPGGFTFSDERPFLRDRQRTIKERLASLR